ncbi:MAG: SDR family oxidoreductase [Proteobacteria bacterium]|jgi:enoyl-[acyl-carrier protein] reductase III|nr:SDR family oxidoreductase [Pseudomonadota bacterium]
MTTTSNSDWALILGASSGFGAAAALALAHDGFNIFGVHLDRRSALPEIEALTERIRAAGRQAVFFNVNAAAANKRAQVLDSIADQVGAGSQVRVLLHSLAFGALKPLVADDAKERIDPPALEMTLDVMANSLVYWTQELVGRNLMRAGGRVFAMTSAGSIQIWKSYGAVSAAKCALESHCRQLAVELAPHGITANALMAGVTDTPALRKIPGHEHMIRNAEARNPYHRLTRPEDVAGAIVLLTRPEAAWITGNTLRIDGGESIAG